MRVASCHGEEVRNGRLTLRPNNRWASIYWSPGRRPPDYFWLGSPAQAIIKRRRSSAVMISNGHLAIRIGKRWRYLSRSPGLAIMETCSAPPHLRAIIYQDPAFRYVSLQYNGLNEIEGGAASAPIRTKIDLRRSWWHYRGLRTAKKGRPKAAVNDIIAGVSGRSLTSARMRLHTCSFSWLRESALSSNYIFSGVNEAAAMAPNPNEKPFVEEAYYGLSRCLISVKRKAQGRPRKRFLDVELKPQPSWFESPGSS